jgi:hypothetical protein
MKKIIFNFSIIFFLVCHSIVNAQLDFWPGYVLLNEKDTLSGFIAAQTDYLNCRQCVYSKTVDGDSKTYYSPTEIIGYRYENGRYFISKSIELDTIQKTVFVEFLVNGVSNLYYYRNDNDYYFVENENSELTRLFYNEVHFYNEWGHEKIKYNEQYKGALKYLYRDYPELYGSINQLHFDQKSLIKISKKYHEKVCPDEECIVYSKSTKNKAFFETKLGLSYSLLGVETSSDYASDVSVNIGVHFRFVPARIFYRWNFLFGIDYSNASYSGEFLNTILEDINGTSIEDNWRIDLKYHMIKIPLMAQYTFPLKNIQPSIFFGYDNIFVLNSEYSDYGTSHYLGKAGFTKYLSGFIFGIGLGHEMKNNRRLFLDFEYESMKRIFYPKYASDYMLYHFFTINLGIDFPLK